jgi:GTP-binding protein
MTSPKARFITTAVEPKQYPTIRNHSGKILSEVAVVGRSNVGKSSLLNHLFQVEGLVRTSCTPGKTQTLNFFSWDNIAFADLPGYGYAKVPAHIKKEWGPMIQAYLEKRETLKVILFLLDIRREPSEDDLQLMDWIIRSNKAVILVLTKVDKANQSEKILFTKRILSAFPAMNLHYTHYSVLKGRGRKELLDMIKDAIKNEEAIEDTIEETTT